MPPKSAAKRSLHGLGYRIEKIDPSECLATYAALPHNSRLAQNA